MCGIAGIVDGEHRMKYRNQQAVEDMLDTMKRRGPDQQNIYTDEAVTLLHARLSVMDLQHGKQPMQLKSDPRYVMVYNGELYNTEELRRELQKKGYAFQETSDTEVLLQAFIEWKETVVERLNGIFAFALYDEEKDEYLIARDPIGVIPLYIGKDAEGHVYFGTHTKTFSNRCMNAARISVATMKKDSTPRMVRRRLRRAAAVFGALGCPAFFLNMVAPFHI